MTRRGEDSGREQGSIRYHPEYMQSPYKHPEKVVAWCGTSAGGQRILHILGPNEAMTAARFVLTLEKPEVVKKSMLLPYYHDKATVQQDISKQQPGPDAHQKYIWPGEAYPEGHRCMT